MSERNKKDNTPPPLMFMPAGGGLTLTPPEQPNVLMPIVQAEASLFGPEDEGLGEADSFVGQTPPSSSHISPISSQSTSGLFHSVTSTPDPFSQIDHAVPTQPPSQPQQPFQDPVRPPAPSTGVPPLVPTSSVPMGVPPMAAVSPMPNTSGLAGLYRKHGSSRYAQMPSGTYGGSSPSNLMSGPPAPVPFSKNFSEAAMLEPTSYPVHQMEPEQPPPPPPSMGPLPGMGYVPSATGIYIPVSHHWCFCKEVEGRDIWYQFSMADSLSLEDAGKPGADTSPIPTDGGRYDVNVGERRRYAVYWEEDPVVVRRCSWFYKREGDNRYVPYEEEFCTRLEDEYRSAVTTGVWHKRLEFSSGETFVMHNPSVMVHFQASSQPDEWGTLQVSNSAKMQGDQMRPRVVKRGVGDFESIEEGESRQVDHLVFVVHGIGSICDVRFRNIVECVDDFRSISQSLLKSHFSQYVDSNRIGRVEFLPIHWHKALHSDATGIDRRLKAITLPSTQKLRHFVNDTLMDILFYTSPTYCQCIADAVGSEINRIYELFLSRNPGYNAGVSVAGHSLGSCILFDLLQHQSDPEVERAVTPEPVMTNGVGELDLTAQNADDTEVTADDALDDVDDPDDDPSLTLDDLLTRVGLQEKQGLFEREQIDMESLIMCSESDLKDLGLPMGPRKKLQGILREEMGRKDKKKAERERRVREQEDREMRERLAAEMAATQLAQQLQANKDQGSPHQSDSLTVDYLLGSAGTGQPQVKYPKLPFRPVCCFAFGSPVGLFLSARGVEVVGEEFKLPTCKKYFNIFHPFDPVAYRLEPLISISASAVKPVLMPHHKGRKRLHLELKENLTKMGADIKHKIIASIKSTWNTINDFAKSHKSGMEDRTLEQQVDSEMSTVVQQMVEDDQSDTASVTSYADEDIYMGQLNEGRRVDYVLQERPIESFNDYMFSLTSHGCYWSSEDTVLLVMKEIYGLYGLTPTLPGSDGTLKSTVGPPPMGLPPTGGYYGAPPMSQAPMQQPPQPMSQFMSQPPLGQQSMSQPPLSRLYGLPQSVPTYNPAQMPPQTYNPGSSLMNMELPTRVGSGTPPAPLSRGSTPPAHPGSGSTPPSGLVYNMGPAQPPTGAGMPPPPLAGFMKKL